MSRAANRGSLLVGAGIFVSRIAGLLREMVSGRVLGNSAAAAAGTSPATLAHTCSIHAVTSTLPADLAKLASTTVSKGCAAREPRGA